MLINRFVEKTIEIKGSDLFLRVNSVPMARVCGDIVRLSDEIVNSDLMERMIRDFVKDDEIMIMEQNHGYEGAAWFKDNWRIRIGIFYQRGTPSMVIRIIDLRISGFEELRLPSEALKNLCAQRRGLVLLTGTTGSGKSTTIASMIEYINQTQKKHILSIEEPVEFTFKDKNSIINQREIGKDVKDYAIALRQFALHSPDVIFIGNIRDEETMSAALTAAETGVLVFSTLHTVNAPQTIERILSFFPPYQQDQISMQLSQLLKGVVSLRLIPKKDKTGLVACSEVMVLSPTVSRLIRERKINEIPRYIEEGEIYGMTSFEQSLLKLVKGSVIDAQTALSFSDKKEELQMRIQNT